MMRRLAKSLVIQSGGLGLYHRVKHGQALTVLMFHRVLPSDLQTTYAADGEYTISTHLLEHLLAFVRRHYNVVSLEDVTKSRNKIVPLPSRPLLITFDDGWDDNAIFAAPILARLKMPWTLFVATDAMETGQHWWQESLLAILRSGNVEYEALLKAASTDVKNQCAGLPDDKVLALLILYGRLPPTQRDSIIAKFAVAAPGAQRPRDMASWDTIKKLCESGVAIGAHGTSHLPLTHVSDPGLEISQSRIALEQHLGSGRAMSMSFPHGQYSQPLIEKARQEGMKLVFTSDPVLNRCPGGWLGSDVLGRISIGALDVAEPPDKLQLSRLMPWLMLRPQAVVQRHFV